MAEETATEETVTGAVSPVELTLSLTPETSPYAYLITDESAGGTGQSMTTNQNAYKTFYVNLAESGDYDMLVTTISFGVNPALDIYIDDVYMGKCDVDAILSTSYGQPFKTVGLEKGEHKIKVQCVAGNPYFSKITLTKTGEQTRDAYTFKYYSNSSGATIGDGTDGYPVYAYSPGVYSNVYANGWAQYKLPDNHYAGWYKLSLYTAANGTKTINAYIGDAQATSSTIVGRTIATTKHKYGETGQDTYSKYSLVDIGIVYLDGTNNYLTIGAGTEGDIRFSNVYLVPYELSGTQPLQMLSQNNSNPNGSNNYGKIYQNGAGSGTITYAPITVDESGAYRLKMDIALSEDAAAGATMKFKLGSTVVAEAPITSTAYGTFVTEDFGIVDFSKRQDYSISLVPGTTASFRIKNIYLERVKVGEVDTFTMATNGNQQVINNTANNGTNKGKYNCFNADTVIRQNNSAVYKVNVAKAGKYKVIASTATSSAAGKMELYVNSYTNNGVYGSYGVVKVPASTYTTFVRGTTWIVDLVEGVNTLRFVATGADYRFNAFYIQPVYETTITDSTEAVVSTLGTRTDDTLTVKGPSDITDAYMVAALYKNGDVVNADVGESDGTQLVATLENVTTTSDDTYELRVFYWDSLEELTPLVAFYVVK